LNIEYFLIYQNSKIFLSKHMEETKNALAIILRNTAYKERDSQIDVFSKEFGRLDLVVRGTKDIRSKLAGQIEPISLCDIMVVKGRLRDYLGAAVAKNSFLNIKNDLEKIEMAGKAMKIYLDHIRSGEPETGLFFLLKDYLEALEDLDIKNHGLFFSFLLLKFAVMSGFAPELFNYVENGEKIRPENNFFDITKGGIVSRKQNENCFAVSNDCIKILRLTVKENFKTLNNLKTEKKLAEEAGTAIEQFFQYNF
jgi:DNA repair protein RecO (recombination protein O)